MIYDLSKIETRDLRLCEACRTKPHECDKYCRRCGARLHTPGATEGGGDSSSTRATSSLQQDVYMPVSGRLVAVASTSLTYHIAPLNNRLTKGLISALLSIPIWMIIMILSPFDAYVTARTISKRI
jgi:hypothetical protein